MALDYTGVKLDGAKRLRTTLRRAGVDMKDMRAAHADIARIVVSANHTPYRDGDLDATVRAGATQTASIVRAGNNRKKNGVPYANPIHWGWHKRNIRPHPFLSLAAQRSEPSWFSAYNRHIEKILAKIKGL